MIREGIVARILADATTTELIGDRIYPDNLPDECPTPAVSFRRISTVDSYTLDGPLGLVQIRLQVDSWAARATQAEAVAAALYTLLNDYTGTLPNGVQVQNIWRDGEMDGFDSGLRAYYVQTDWMILFTAS